MTRIIGAVTVTAGKMEGGASMLVQSGSEKKVEPGAGIGFLWADDNRCASSTVSPYDRNRAITSQNKSLKQIFKNYCE